MRRRNLFVAQTAPLSAVFALAMGALTLTGGLADAPIAAAQPIVKDKPAVLPGPASSIISRVVPKLACSIDDKLQAMRVIAVPTSDASSRPAAGRVVTIKGTVHNFCTVPVSVPWRVTRTVKFPSPDMTPYNEVILSGTFEDMPGGASVEITCGTWTALGGAHTFTFEADPTDTLHDTSRGNNRVSLADYRVTEGASWAAWGSAAKVSAQQGANQWLALGRVNGDVTSSVLSFGKGTTLLMTSRPFDVQPMMAAGASGDVTYAFAVTTTEVWMEWIASYQGPTVPSAFPSFAAFPGPTAPPTPATPTSLPLMAGTGKDPALSASEIVALLSAKLGPTMKQASASAAVSDYATWLSAEFAAWRGKAQLSRLSGSGSVPSYAPPSVTSGPVLHGTVTANISGGF